MKAVIFDLDGTLADIYADEDWKEKIVNSDASLYLNAEPLVNVNEFENIINKLKSQGWKLAIATCVPIKFYEEACLAKAQWLENTFKRIQWDDILFLRGSLSKRRACKFADGILFDDNEKQRHSWNLGQGHAEDETNIVYKLKKLLEGNLTESVRLSESTKSDILEKEATKWLTDWYQTLHPENTQKVFTHMGSNRNTVSDIKVNSTPSFYIEVKDKSAQAGEFKVFIDETPEGVIVTPKDKILSKFPLIQAITERASELLTNMPEDMRKNEHDEWYLRSNDSKFRDLMIERIKSKYINQLHAKYMIAAKNSKEFNIIKTENFTDAIEVPYVFVRLKANNSSSMTKPMKAEFEKYLHDDEYGITDVEYLAHNKIIFNAKKPIEFTINGTPVKTFNNSHTKDYPKQQYMLRQIDRSTYTIIAATATNMNYSGTDACLEELDKNI